MAKAQTGSTTYSAPKWVYSTVWTTGIATLRANIKKDKIVYFEDMQNLKDAIVSMMDHYHSYTDLYQNAEYGNNGDRATYTLARNSSAVANKDPVSANFKKDGIIYASDHNVLRNNTVRLQSHNHTGLDQNSA